MMTENLPLFRVEVAKQVDKRLEKIQPKHRKQILARMAELTVNPRPQDSIKLKGTESYRLNTGDYRVLYDIDYQSKIVRIWRVIDRKEGYKNLT